MRHPVPYGKYLLLDRISVGGMAEVFKAKAFGVQGFEKILAIKRILPNLDSDDEFIRLFINEAKLAAQLSHANIAQVHELGAVDGSHFIAMEYIWGRDLLQIQNRYKKRKLKIPEEMAALIVLRMCEALDYAHRKRDMTGESLNLVHRDVSPQNVVISYEGEVKVIDFGIARAANVSNRTQAGVLKGKYGYMSPEQVRGLPIDRRSDLFAVGTILYELLSGQRLFAGESDFMTLEKVRNAQVDTRPLEDAGVAPGLVNVVVKALERDPEDRYQWCGEMRRALLGYMQELEGAYSNRDLSSELMTHFDKERRREAELMEFYSKIDADGAVAENAMAPSESSEILVHASGKTSSKASGAKSRDEFSDGPTEIFDGLVGGGTNDETADIELEEEETFRDGSTADDDEETLRPAATPKPAPSASKSEQEAGNGSGARHPSLSELVLEPVELPKRSAEAGASTLAGLDSSPKLGAVSVATSTTPAPRHSSTAKMSSSELWQKSVDTGIPFWVKMTGVAVVTAGLVTLLLLYLSSNSGSSAAPTTGSVVVVVDDQKAAEVVLDDGERMVVPANEALTLDAIELGTFKLRVVRGGTLHCEGRVEVKPGRPAVFICPIQSPDRSHLKLFGLVEGDTIVVDGRPLPAIPEEGLVSLSPNRTHLIAISRDGHLYDEFEVQLELGQTLERSIEPEEVVVIDGGVPDAKVRRGKATQTREDEPTSFISLESTELDGEGDDHQDNSEKGGTTKDGSRPSTRLLQAPDFLTDGADDVEVTESAIEADESAPGYLVSFTKPWARIHIDGEDTGRVSPVSARRKIPLAPGTHQVTFVRDGQRFSYPVTIEPGKTTRLDKILPIVQPETTPEETESP